MHHMQEIKLTLWKREGKKADGTPFVSFSASSDALTGVDSWVNGYRRVANTKDGPVDVIDLVIKPKQQKTGPMSQTDIVPKQAPKEDEKYSSEPPF